MKKQHRGKYDDSIYYGIRSGNILFGIFGWTLGTWPLRVRKEMIHPTVRLIYYMFLNERRCDADADCANLRMELLPFTVQDCQGTIEKLCRYLEEENHVGTGSITVNKITTDFSHFKTWPWRMPVSYIPITNSKRITVTHNMNGPFRRAK